MCLMTDYHNQWIAHRRNRDCYCQYLSDRYQDQGQHVFCVCCGRESYHKTAVSDKYNGNAATICSSFQPFSLQKFSNFLSHRPASFVVLNASIRMPPVCNSISVACCEAVERRLYIQVAVDALDSPPV